MTRPIDDFERLLAFDPSSTDWLADCVKEAAHVCECDPERARALVDEEVRFDNLCKARTLSVAEYLRGPDLPAHFHYVLAQVTQPLRRSGPHSLKAVRAVTEFIDRLPEGSGHTVLDYGGGGGRDCIIFARRGLRPTLLETSAYMLNPMEGPMIARRFAGRSLDVEIITHGSVAAASYDFVNSLSVLEHVYDVEYSLADMTLALKEGGHLFIWGDFDAVTYQGDHLERNRFYHRSGVWPALLGALGHRLVVDQPDGAFVEVWKLERRVADSIEALLKRAYETTRQWAQQQLLKRHAESAKYWVRGAAGVNGKGGLPPHSRALQNLADTIYTLEFATERLRHL